MKKSDDIPTLLDAEEAFESGDIETALAIVEGMIGEDEGKAPLEVLYLASECLLELQEAAEAGHLLDAALKREPDNPALLHARGISHFEQGQLAESKAYFQRAADSDETLGEPLFYLGILAERAGEDEVAAGLFEQAVERDPENLVVPTKWSVEALQQAFDEIVEEIPDPLGAWLAGLDIRMAGLPPAGLLRGPEDEPVSPLILCFFEGEGSERPEGGEPDEWLEARPEAVHVFAGNLGKCAHDEYELHHELLEALIWEVMDFLNLDETHLAALGLPDEGDDEDLH